MAQLQSVIHELLNRHSFLHEKRIHKLVFLADLHSIQTRGRRLVDADFKQYYHGVFSEELHLALQNLQDARVAPETAPDGRDTVVFLQPERPYVTSLPVEDLSVLLEAWRAYKDLSTEDLAQIGKHTVLWQESDFGDVFDYDTYLKDPRVRMSASMVAAFDAAHAEESRGEIATFDSVDSLLESLN